MSPSNRKLTNRIGAVAEGVDLTAPPDPLRSLADSKQAVGDASHYSSVLELEDAA
ncbi:hypothetical protein [Streptomyces sp. NPDC059468]|uniref:hypothetical protein n=1 Tax=unclassified Streptomyces TaxID=2593676 RepID=UPI0036B05624